MIFLLPSDFSSKQRFHFHVRRYMYRFLSENCHETCYDYSIMLQIVILRRTKTKPLAKRSSLPLSTADLPKNWRYLHPRVENLIKKPLTNHLW